MPLCRFCRAESDGGRRRNGRDWPKTMPEGAECDRCGFTHGDDVSGAIDNN